MPDADDDRENAIDALGHMSHKEFSDLMRSAQMRDAIQRQMEQSQRSKVVDRTGWTDEQWIDDARALMGHLDGAITSLVNGHVLALLREIDRLDTEFAS